MVVTWIRIIRIRYFYLPAKQCFMARGDVDFERKALSGGQQQAPGRYRREHSTQVKPTALNDFISVGDLGSGLSGYQCSYFVCV